MNALTAEEMRQADMRTVEDVGIPPLVLMESAGRAVADLARDFLDDLDGDPIRVAVVAGPGNNGADALVAARYLMQVGFEPDIYMAAKPEDCGELCRAQLDIMEGLGASISFLREQSPEFFRSGLRAAALIIDGLLGTGSSGPLRDQYRAWVHEINIADRDVIAVEKEEELRGGFAGRALQRVAQRVSVIEDGPLPRLMRITSHDVRLYPGSLTHRLVNHCRFPV